MQASNSTGRSTGNDQDNKGTVKVEQSFAFDRQVSFNDITKRAPGKP